MKIYPNFHTAITAIGSSLEHVSLPVQTERWQGVDASKPEMLTYECMDVDFKVAMPSNATVLANDVNPNMPWAEDHFQERVSGKPLNPGVQWANWPYAKSADRFRTESEKFTHTYMERYWPKFAGAEVEANVGTRYPYGDLNDIVALLTEQPFTRQAYMPVWFPEDTGVVHRGRVPCTLGYHFMRRANYLHVWYYLRSCDFVRHFRDDIYLTVRLVQWMLDKLRRTDASGVWAGVTPGFYHMSVASMHIFKNDYRVLFSRTHPLEARQAAS